jgi:hypothetical protein
MRLVAAARYRVLSRTTPFDVWKQEGPAVRESCNRAPVKNFDPPRQGWTPEYQKSQEGLIGRVFDVS